MEPLQNICAACAAHKDNMNRCSRCGITRYCSKECQTRDWPEHKLTCKEKHDTSTNNNNNAAPNNHVEVAIESAKKNANLRIAEKMCKNVKLLPVELVSGIHALFPNRFLHFQYIGKNVAPTEKELVASMKRSLKYLYMIHTDVMLYVDEIPCRDMDMDAMLGDPDTTHISVPKLNGEFTFVMSSWTNKQGNAHHIPVQLIRKK